MFSKKILLVVATMLLLLVSSLFAYAAKNASVAYAEEAPSALPSAEATPLIGVAETPTATPTPEPSSSETSEPTPEELAQLDEQLYKDKAIAWEAKAKKARSRFARLRMALALQKPAKLVPRSSMNTWQARYEYYKNRATVWNGKITKIRLRLQSEDWNSRPLYGKKLKCYIIFYARICKLDPAATLAVASYEGKFAGAMGDNGTSFGPWQLHVGGALPSNIGNPRRWANSPRGIRYALRCQAKVARGLQGYSAVNAIVRRFERPGNPSLCVQVAWNYYPATKRLVILY